MTKKTATRARVGVQDPCTDPCCTESSVSITDMRKYDRNLIVHQDVPFAYNIPSDVWNSILLFVLYTFQGIPMGIGAAVPFLLLGKITYTEQGLFSLSSWPFRLVFMRMDGSVLLW